MRKQTTCYSCDKPIEPEWLPEGEFIVCDECSSDTDELSVEKLQEIRVEELKDFNSKILQAELKNQKLQEQLNTAKKALTEIVNANNNLFLNVDGRGDLDTALDNARDALAAIGGNNE